MVMEKLGPNLGTLFKHCNRKFSKKTTAMIGIQMLDLIQYLHSQSWMHRDIKPENFVIGDFSSCNSKVEATKMAQNLYMIDLGLAGMWLRADGKHIKFKDNRTLTGWWYRIIVYTCIFIPLGPFDSLIIFD